MTLKNVVPAALLSEINASHSHNQNIRELVALAKALADERDTYRLFMESVASGETTLRERKVVRLAAHAMCNLYQTEPTEFKQIDDADLGESGEGPATNLDAMIGKTELLTGAPDPNAVPPAGGTPAPQTAQDAPATPATS